MLGPGDGGRAARRFQAPLRAHHNIPPTPRTGAVWGVRGSLSTARDPSAALSTAPIHDLDLQFALWLVTSPPDSVVGTGSGETNPGY